MRRIALLLALAAAPLAAQTSPAPDGREFHGRTVHVEFADGMKVDTSFKSDGTFSGSSGTGPALTGTYKVQPGQMCLAYANGQNECWAYTQALVPGQTIESVAPDGTKVKITLRR